MKAGAIGSILASTIKSGVIDKPIHYVDPAVAVMGSIIGAKIGYDELMKGLDNIREYYFSVIVLNDNLEILDHKKYLEDTNRYLKNVDALQLLCYWSYYAIIAYESYLDLPTYLPILEGYFVYGNETILSVSKPFYYMMIDHISESIVISVRGTHNVADGISDIMGRMVPIDAENEDELAHEGFTVAALSIINVLVSK